MFFDVSGGFDCSVVKSNDGFQVFWGLTVGFLRRYTVFSLHLALDRV